MCTLVASAIIVFICGIFAGYDQCRQQLNVSVYNNNDESNVIIRVRYSAMGN